ncbi:MAG: hypothetical protein QW303_06290 [Nitrososphaerota archaeon]
MSDNYLMLSEHPDNNGLVDILVNKTKSNYLNLGGINGKEVIDSLHSFLCKYDVWKPSDNVVHVKKPLNFVPSKPKYHNISFVLIFYKMACRSREHREKVASTNSVIEIKQPSEEKTIQLNVQHLTNQNMDHVAISASPINKSLECETNKKSEGQEQTNNDPSLEQGKDALSRRLSLQNDDNLALKLEQSKCSNLSGKVDDLNGNNIKSLQGGNQTLDYDEIYKILEDSESDNDDIIKIADSENKQKKKKAEGKEKIIDKRKNGKNKDDKSGRRGRKKLDSNKKKSKVRRKMDKKSRVDTEGRSDSENSKESSSQNSDGSKPDASDVVESPSISENDQLSDSESEKSEKKNSEAEQTKIELVTRRGRPPKSISKKVTLKKYSSEEESSRKRRK